jgi:putative selenium metabolism hydrolase
MDYDAIKAAAEKYAPQMYRFLRALIAIPGESCGEKEVAERIVQEMRALEFDEITVDGLGNVLGFMGSGERVIAFDAHIDTVGVGVADNWNFCPYLGYETDTEIGGRGASDQLGGIVAACYGARIMRDLALVPADCRVLVSGTVQEEDCDGLCWQYILRKMASGRSLWFLPSLRTAKFTAASAGAWRSVWRSRVYPVMARPRNAAIMPSTKWRRLYFKYAS